MFDCLRHHKSLECHLMTDVTEAVSYVISKYRVFQKKGVLSSELILGGKMASNEKVEENKRHLKFNFIFLIFRCFLSYLKIVERD